MQVSDSTDIAVIGAGSIGIAVAYYLVINHGITRIVLIDSADPMAMTSAQSGENYRNWWPHPVMTAFTDDATDLLEDIARQSGNRINMTRRGYVLATRRRTPDDLIAELHRAYGDGRAPPPAINLPMTATGERRPTVWTCSRGAPSCKPASRVLHPTSRRSCTYAGPATSADSNSGSSCWSVSGMPASDCAGQPS